MPWTSRQLNRHPRSPYEIAAEDDAIRARNACAVPDWKRTEPEKLLARLQEVRANLEALVEEPEDFWMQEETAEEARARMTPEDAEVDRLFAAKLEREADAEQSRQEWHDELQSQYQRDAI